MKRKVTVIILILILAAFGIWRFTLTLRPLSTDGLKVTQVLETTFFHKISTEEYMEAFNPKAYEMAGTDYFNDIFSPHRLKKPLDQIDRTYDFDFAYLAQVSRMLEHVDRKRALKAIFDRVTSGAKTDTQRHLAILKFLQKAAFHNYWMQPIYEDKQLVFDPLVLLELGAMQCGAVARVGADLFDAAGYRTRVVQAANHVSAEIFYEGGWRLLEADLYRGGQAPMLKGRIMSVNELSYNPSVMDRLPTRFTNYVHYPPKERLKKSFEYSSFIFFSKWLYGNLKPCWYYKTATPEQAAASRFYGWNYYSTIPDKERKLTSTPVKYEPTQPVFKSVDMTNQKVKITWNASYDRDHDLMGYRIYLSRKSRGWNYQYFIGDEKVKKYWHGGWRPEMYDSLFREPPSDAGLITTSRMSVEIDLPHGEVKYVTIMPFDRYGESVGRKLYLMSEELTLTR